MGTKRQSTEKAQLILADFLYLKEKIENEEIIIKLMQLMNSDNSISVNAIWAKSC